MNDVVIKKRKILFQVECIDCAAQNLYIGTTDWYVCIRVGGGEEETRSGTEKQCSHNLQKSHPMWWSEDNSSIFPAVNILIEARSQMAEEMIKKWKK